MNSRNLLIILFLIILPGYIKAKCNQDACINADRVYVPLYLDSIGTIPAMTLYQNFDIFNSDSLSDHAYNVIIKEKSSSRYLVNVFDICLQDGNHVWEGYNDPFYDDSFFKVACGWIDKTYIGVWERWYWDENGEIFVKLLKEPRSSDNPDDYTKTDLPTSPLSLLDFTEDGRYMKVMYYVDDIQYIGWLDKFCKDIINGCT